MTYEAIGVNAATEETTEREEPKEHGQRRIGASGRVGPIGLGCMNMSWGYGDRGSRDEAASIEVIHRALERGVNLLDTADAYGPFTNEKLVGQAIAGRRDEAFVATKVGYVTDGTLNYHRNGRPEHIHGACDASLARLGVYAPLGRGFLTGNIASRDDLPADDWRRNNPRFSDEAIRANSAIVDAVRDIAAKHDATPAQVALSWLLHQGEHVIPIPGTKTLRYLEQNVEAARLPLEPTELAMLNGLTPAVGNRY